MTRSAILRPVSLPDAVPGSLWLASMPGRYESWSAFLAAARQVDLDRVVCLTPLYEIEGNSPSYLAAIQSGDLPFAWDHLPMRNHGIALQDTAFAALVQRTAERLRAGDDVMVHCAAGIGRTGTFAACLLKALGREASQALADVRAAGSNPESAAQAGLIDRF